METPVKRDSRLGMSLVEVLVVTVLGSLILLATYNVLITNQRTYTLNAANMQGQQTVRAGMDVLFSELREISAQGGDLLRMNDDSITIRVMRAAGIVCDTTRPGASEQFRWGIVNLGDTIAVGDSVWVFAEHEPTVTSDDVWVRHRIQELHGAGTCGGYTTQRVRFTAPVVADTPTLGSLMRTYLTYTYGLGTYNGAPYLIRKLQPAGSAIPLVGPLMAGSGVGFEYLDADGNATTVSTDVRQIVVTLRTRHEARDAAGQQVMDSLKTRIFTRN
jgi:prepilin-type N-terminal cleavage/methylation domain-containing protein